MVRLPSDRVSRTFSSLRTRNFRLFFTGQLVSNSGNWLTTVAITLLVLAVVFTRRAAAGPRGVQPQPVPAR